MTKYVQQLFASFFCYSINLFNEVSVHPYQVMLHLAYCMSLKINPLLFNAKQQTHKHYVTTTPWGFVVSNVCFCFMIIFCGHLCKAMYAHIQNIYVSYRICEILVIANC